MIGEYFAASQRQRGSYSSNKKKSNKLNYAFLKPQVVPSKKEECRPSSSIRYSTDS